MNTANMASWLPWFPSQRAWGQGSKMAGAQKKSAARTRGCHWVTPVCHNLNSRAWCCKRNSQSAAPIQEKRELHTRNQRAGSCLWTRSRILLGLQTCSLEARLSTATDLEPRQGSNSVVLARRSSIHTTSLNILPLKTDQSRSQPPQQQRQRKREGRWRKLANIFSV